MKKGFLSVLAAGLVVGGMAAQIAPAAAATPMNFTDVDATNPYYSFINDLGINGVLVGKSGSFFDGTAVFGPNDKLTRAEFATMLVQTLKLQISAKPTQFTDSKSHWAKAYIETAYENGIVAGTSSTTFSPDALVKREEAAAMVWRYMNNHMNQLSPSVDQVANTDAWALDSVRSVIEAGFYCAGEVTQSQSTGIFDYGSQRDMTRQEAAALIDGAFRTLYPATTSTTTTTSQYSWDKTTPLHLANATLVQNSDGTFSPGNTLALLPLPESIAKWQTQSELNAHLALFSKVKISFNGNQCTVSVPDSGSPSLDWNVVDTTAGFDGTGAKTMTFTGDDTTNKAVGITLSDNNTANVLAQLTIGYSDGKWTPTVIQD